MGCSEWAALSSAEFNLYVDAWLRKQEREQRRVEDIDKMFAQVAYHTAVPILKNCEGVKADDYRIFRKDIDTDIDPEQIEETKDFAESYNARLMKEAAKINRVKNRKNNGKNSPKRTSVQRPR